MDDTPMTTIVLKCVYAGFPGEPGPGAVIEVDADEAARLFGLGAADAFAAPQEADPAA